MNAKLLRLTAFPCLALAVAGAADTAPEHQMLASGAALKWGAPPPILAAGAKFAVIDGDPAAKGNVTVRLMMPAGYSIAPHWHPTDEHVTVLSGTLGVGMGDTLDKAHATTLRTGGYVAVLANMHHYAFTRTGATIQLHLQGPFGLTYVNPADDPSQSAKKSP